MAKRLIRASRVAQLPEHTRRSKRFSRRGSYYFWIWTQDIIYYVNFNFAENPEATNDSGIFGSLTSPKYIPLQDAKKIIKANVPIGYTPVEFYEAEEEGKQNKVILTIFRDSEEIEVIELDV